MAIQHNVYEDGNVQSLGFTNAEGVDLTVGVLEPGEYNFGVAKRRETIRVVYGLIEAKETASSPDTFIIFEPGEQIKLKCYSVTAYICLYG